MIAYLDAGSFQLIGVGLFLPVGLGMALIPAYIAKSKGHSFGAYFLFGLFCFLPALIVALVIQPANKVSSRIDCPRCGESIPGGATMCRFCDLDLSRPTPSRFQ